MGINGVFAAVHDPVNRQLNVTGIDAAPVTSTGTHDPSWVLDQVYDPTTGTIRVVLIA